MSKPVKQGGHVDKIDMEFKAANEEEVKPTDVIAVEEEEGEEKPIEFSHDGKKVYVVKNGVYTFFDADGKPMSDTAIDSINTAYAAFPEYDNEGREKDGSVSKFEVDEEGRQSGHPKYSGNVFMTSYKQKYKGEDGSTNTLDHTILQKHESIVKVLRGEIGHDKK
jgi:hypothetical protein